MRRATAELKRRIHDEIADDLGRAIVSGRHLPGQSIPGEIAASQELGVSRNVYREAVRILAAKGLVESRQKAGTLVTPRDRWNLLDPAVISWLLADPDQPAFRDLLFELRMIIEPAAAALAAARRTQGDVRAIEAALADMRRELPDSPAGEQADERFHAAILSAGRNEIVSRLATIVAASVSFVAEYKRERHVCRDAWPDHKMLSDAIRDSRPGVAHDAMTQLIAHAREDVGEVGSVVPGPPDLTDAEATSHARRATERRSAT